MILILLLKILNFNSDNFKPGKCILKFVVKNGNCQSCITINKSNNVMNEVNQLLVNSFICKAKIPLLVYVLGYAIGVGKTIKTIRQAFKYEGYTYEKFHDVINK